MEGGIFVSGAITVLSKERLKKILVDLGIQKGMLLLVEIDYKKIGYVIGGIQTVVEALMDVVGYEGTIVVPTFTMQLLDPACSEIAFEREDWEEIRANTRTFDRHLSVPGSECEFVNQFLRNEGVAEAVILYLVLRHGGNMLNYYVIVIRFILVYPMIHHLVNYMI